MQVVFAGSWLRLLEYQMRGKANVNPMVLALGVAVRDAAWALVRLRNAVRPQPTVKLPVPVISVGNITVGGTGKTPLTRWLCQRLYEIGHRPAALTPLPMSADEPQEHLSNAPMLRCSRTFAVYGGRDRIVSAERAIGKGATVIVLDDGFQYRRLYRDMDIVLWDATAWLHPASPFLREPLTALRRATAVVLSKADALDDATRKTLCSQLNEFSGGEKVVAAFGYVPTEPSSLQSLRGDGIKGMRVVAATGIANPRYFVQTALRAGCDVAALICFPDHHRFTPKDAALVAGWAQREGADAVLTTHKDAVKWKRVWKSDVPLLVLDFRLEWLWGETGLWQKILMALNTRGIS